MTGHVSNNRGTVPSLRCMALSGNCIEKPARQNLEHTQLLQPHQTAPVRSAVPINLCYSSLLSQTIANQTHIGSAEQPPPFHRHRLTKCCSPWEHQPENANTNKPPRRKQPLSKLRGAASRRHGLGAAAPSGDAMRHGSNRKV